MYKRGNIVRVGIGKGIPYQIANSKGIVVKVSGDWYYVLCKGYKHNTIAFEYWDSIPENGDWAFKAGCWCLQENEFYPGD